MKLKAALLDFDGTLVTKDMLSVVAEIVGKYQESEESNERFMRGEITGKQSRLERINFLSGVTLDQIESKVKENLYLMPGVEQLMDYFHKRKIVTILSSGNIVPVLEIYQQILGIDYVIGSRPRVEQGVVQGITDTELSAKGFKLRESREILNHLRISANETVAIGDSIAEREVFEFVGMSIAINPKGGIEEFADHVIRDDLGLAIAIMEKTAQ